MDSNVQPSFIPKKPVTQPGPKSVHTTSFFSIIATVLFITAIALAIIVFSYKFFLNKSIEHKQEALQTELDKFEPKLVQDLSHLDARLNSANELIKNHFSLTYFLSALSKATLKNIQYNSFGLSITDQKAVLLIEGKAKNFSAVALQMDELTRPNTDNAKYFKNVVITNPSLDNEGNVTFALTSDVNVSNFTYPMANGGVTLNATNPISATTTGTSSKSTTSTKATPQ